MTGRQIADLRARLKLSAADFADLLGVGLSTAYRWEQFGEAKAPVGAWQLRLMRLLLAKVTLPPERERGRLVALLRQGLDEGGGLRGLHAFLLHLYGEP